MKLSTMQKMTQGLVLTIIVIVIAGAMDYYKDMKRPKIATIDILTLVKEHEKKLTDLLYQGVKNLDSANVDLAQQSKIADIENQKFTKQLNSAVQKISDECKCILVNKAALLSDTNRVKDYTQQVRETIYQK
ncbi:MULTISPECIES: hypothetical protein [Acinetobacter calcoaceticus/baumannii complex]|jgi:hypothetical protein|uniref:Uncharacterized protein n=3 Tax=Acinetobacter baumannii TaxID=470 RepID=A0A075X4T0_ACIBA|nr:MULTISPECIES: hypothetical protein [Acinetobacter calcoaceticus/baumannii complex]AIH08018.1 hypothetical protein [Acinetobacter baumannii]AIZ49315.1 hypothetical protein [Acinetobacter baumannii]ANC38853.1 hypothetical protein Aba3207_19725 [Acinetobacter baumannii]ATR89646.1 hypothetical protein CTI08_20315 [Acinetobacter baumannii]AXW92655.1 hypothetical protein Aba7847_19730 [Acinetobacter baumannii]